MRSEKNIILYIGHIPKGFPKIFFEYAKKEKRDLKLALLYDSRKKPQAIKDDYLDIPISCNFNSSLSITKALLPHQDKFLAVVCRSDKNIPYFQKVIPHLPYLRTPDKLSLHWATDKIEMRNRFNLYDNKITPKFIIAENAKKETIKKIEEKVGFPLVVKPTGFEGSLLVSMCFHKEELEKNLKTVFRKMRTVHKKISGRGEPRVLVEQFMEGEMYSVDAYVNSRGKVYFCPFVHIKTGKSIGFDDFFGYRRLTPVNLKKYKIEKAKKISEKAIYALSLRSVTAHIELMKTEDGWKVIEIGPRLGGFRHKMYRLSYGINHAINDFLIRIPEKPIIPKKVKGHTSVMQFYAKKEGRLVKIKGIKKIEKLKSFFDIKVNKKLGDRCIFAKHGGNCVFEITLFNKDRSELLADIRRLEQIVDIITK